MDGREWAGSSVLVLGTPGPRRNDHTVPRALAWLGIPGTIRSEAVLGFRPTAAGRSS